MIAAESLDKSEKSVVILVNGDEKSIELIQDTLEEFEYKVILARNWEAARDAVKSACASLIIVDMDSPFGSAAEILDNIRECELTNEIPVIIVSSLDVYDFNVMYPLTDNETVMTKPVPVEEFISKVKEAIGE